MAYVNTFILFFCGPKLPDIYKCCAWVFVSELQTPAFFARIHHPHQIHSCPSTVMQYGQSEGSDHRHGNGQRRDRAMSMFEVISLLCRFECGFKSC